MGRGGTRARRRSGTPCGGHCRPHAAAETFADRHPHDHSVEGSSVDDGVPIAWPVHSPRRPHSPPGAARCAGGRSGGCRWAPPAHVHMVTYMCTFCLQMRVYVYGTPKSNDESTRCSPRQRSFHSPYASVCFPAVCFRAHVCTHRELHWPHAVRRRYEYYSILLLQYSYRSTSIRPLPPSPWAASGSTRMHTHADAGQAQRLIHRRARWACAREDRSMWYPRCGTPSTCTGHRQGQLPHAAHLGPASKHRTCSCCVYFMLCVLHAVRTACCAYRMLCVLLMHCTDVHLHYIYICKWYTRICK